MILISSPIRIENEIHLIHSLFEQGLQLFHIRKPDLSETEMEAFLTAIGIKYREKLVVHSWHQLAERIGISRIHFTEKMRKETSEATLKKYKKKGFQLSTSVHKMTCFNDLPTVFEYAFLSPIFPSISKKNYISDTDFSFEIKKRTNQTIRLVGLGGICAENITTAITIGFDDIALLGTIWNTSNPIANFKRCQKIALSYSL